MSRFKNCLLFFSFPVIYIAADVCFRYRYLIYYSAMQYLFYAMSVIFTLLVFILTLSFMAKHHSASFKHRIAGLLSSVYYTLTIFSSYTFFATTGIFLNYYTFNFMKQEPANTISLVNDVINIWQILLSLVIVSSFYKYFTTLSKTEIINKFSRCTRSSVIVATLIIMLVILVKNIQLCDQCMIVDTNFTVDVTRHLTAWNETKNYIGAGLPERVPVTLHKTGRTPEFNVLLIIFESLRAQSMHAYGYNRETTPFISSLLKSDPCNIYMFDKAYTVSTTTMLAIPAILSGVTPGQPTRHYESFPLVWEYAKMLNYNTFFISSHGMKWYRFDKYYSKNKPDHFWNKDTSGLPAFNDLGIDDRITANKFNEHISSLKKKHFFGVIQFNASHFPYKVPEEYIKWEGRYIDRYDNSVLYQDHLVEKIFSSLKNKDLLQNTVVIMVGDHGEAFREHNSIGHIDTLNTETIRVPLMIYIPNKIEHFLNSAQLKRNKDKNVSVADITPTVINILGLKKQNQIASFYKRYPGINLFDSFNENRSILTMNSCEIIDFNSGLSIIHGRSHYILRTNIVPYRKEFYDTVNDPFENNNLMEKSEYSTPLINEINSLLAENSVSARIMNMFN